MKNTGITAIAFLAAMLCIQSLDAQSLKGMSLNGSTGLYSIPTGRIGWERSSDLGLDFGYHAIIGGGHATNIPKVSLSIAKWVELSAAFDFQPEVRGYGGNDFIGGAKIQFPLTKTALALGGNLQSLNLGNSDWRRYNAGQIYLAVTYAGTFFEMPAETTAVLGKTFSKYTPDFDIDFGMGFDLVLLPKIFEHYVHWIVDFANFSYSIEPWRVDASQRGVLNTGIRIDLSVIPPLKKFKFVIDVLLTDVLDDNRSFAIGGVFGIPIL